MTINAPPTSSDELWTSSDNRLWHMTEEDIWGEFCHHIKHTRRFILGKGTSTSMITTPANWLPHYLPHVEKEVATGSALYRARVNDNGRESTPYPIEEMDAPPSTKAKAGRASSAGIPVLYTAMEKNTAIGEMRASVGAKLTVVTLKAVRNLKLVDLSNVPWIPSAFLAPSSGDWSLPQMVAQTRFLHCVNRALSEPVHPDTVDVQYVPTQYIAEVVRAEGYDGIIYGSSLVLNGHNLVLFDKRTALIQPDPELMEITTVSCGWDVLPVSTHVCGRA